MKLDDLRRLAVVHTLLPPAPLGKAVQRLGFVQADPIMAPARAQDLILRHRATDYRAGDLERRYDRLELEEGVLYAYGFVTRELWMLLHPGPQSHVRLTKLEQRVLDAVVTAGPAHPRGLETLFGRERVVNDWGGYSKATTRALESLRHRGLLRVARRERGIRIYEAISPERERESPEVRLRKLIVLTARILSPVPEKTLRSVMLRFRRQGDPAAVLADLLRSGEFLQDEVDGLSYIWPQDRRDGAVEASRVRFLAPFDPLVWDRRRFEHLWGWPYRFEAYTPAAKRVRGYYALPLLSGDQVIGWANAALNGGKLNVDVGFIGSRPRSREFRLELEREVAALESFLGANVGD